MTLFFVLFVKESLPRRRRLLCAFHIKSEASSPTCNHWSSPDPIFLLSPQKLSAVARYLGVTNSCVTRFVASGQKPDVDDLIKKLWTFCTNVPIYILSSVFPVSHHHRVLFAQGWGLVFWLTARDSMDYYALKWENRLIWVEIGDKSPFGKESQALGPSSMPIQKAISGAGRLKTKKSRLRLHNSGKRRTSWVKLENRLFPIRS